MTASTTAGLSAVLAGQQPQAQTKARNKFSYEPGITVPQRLVAPNGRAIRAGFVINPGVQVIDLSGPWETFQDTPVPGSSAFKPAFELYTVSETLAPIAASGGLKLTPHYTVNDAPQPDVLIIPHFLAPSGISPIHEWMKAAHASTALTASICTGAFHLARTGLLDGLKATTNQTAYDSFAQEFPKVDLQRGPRFVETGRIATSGGLSAGIDLALRIVARYYEDGTAQRVADAMEYAGEGWRR